jgi:hypothetical protein
MDAAEKEEFAALKTYMTNMAENYRPPNPLAVQPRGRS